MNGASAILSELRNRGVRIELRPPDKLYLKPAAPVGPELLERIRKQKRELVNLLAVTDDKVIEATLCSAANSTATNSGPTFPPCPACGGVRYWISQGKVMCGSRTCYSAVRFTLIKIEFHPVN